jgi:hypothetical protein
MCLPILIILFFFFNYPALFVIKQTKKQEQKESNMVVCVAVPFLSRRTMITIVHVISYNAKLPPLLGPRSPIPSPRRRLLLPQEGGGLLDQREREAGHDGIDQMEVLFAPPFLLDRLALCRMG